MKKGMVGALGVNQLTNRRARSDRPSSLRRRRGKYGVRIHYYLPCLPTMHVIKHVALALGTAVLPTRLDVGLLRHARCACCPAPMRCVFWGGVKVDSGTQSDRSPTCTAHDAFFVCLSATGPCCVCRRGQTARILRAVGGTRRNSTARVTSVGRPSGTCRRNWRTNCLVWEAWDSRASQWQTAWGRPANPGR